MIAMLFGSCCSGTLSESVMHNNQPRLRMPWSFLGILALGLIAGCGNGPTGSLVGSPTLTITPAGAQLQLEPGQKLTLGGVTNSDPECKGTVWVLNGVGTLSAPVTVTQSYTGCLTSVSYTAPTTITAGTTVTLTATSNRTPVQTATITITLNAALAFSSSTTIPVATAGVPYSTTVTTTNGSSPITYSVSTGTLPAGLTLNSSTGVLSGTPTLAGSYPFTISAVDFSAVPVTVRQNYTLAVDPAISTTSLSNAIAGTSYSQPIAVTGAGSTVTYALVTGTLPTGVTLTSTGLGGIPTVAGTYTFTLKATSNAESSAASSNYTVNVFSITPSTLPGGVMNTAYSQQLTAAGAAGGPYTIAESGTLPTGITYAGGLLSGTPTQSGNFPVSIQIMDAHGNMSPVITYELVISTSALSCTPTTLPGGATSVAYSQTIACSGGPGTTPSFAVTSGTLPNGLTLAPATGIISGTPVLAGTYNFTITASEQTATTPVVTYTQALSYTNVVITASPLTITTSSLPSGVDGNSYSQQITYTGGAGTAPTWHVSVATTPAPGTVTTATNLTIAANGNPANFYGALSATPLKTYGTFNVTLSLTVGTQNTSTTLPLMITLTPLVITTTSLPNSVVGYPYNQQLTYTGGPGGTPTWSYTTGSPQFPSPITLSSSGDVATTGSNYPTVPSTTNNVCVTLSIPPSTTQQCYNFVVASFAITSPSTAYGEAELPFSFPLTGLGGAPPYTWTVSNSTPLPAGLSLSSSTGIISGTPTTAATTSITIQAADSVGATVTTPLSLVINPARTNANNSQLSGQYAFLLSGFDSQHNPLAMVGEFSANGAGVISATGTFDINGTGLSAAQTAQTMLASTYTLGADGRGTLKLTNGTSSGICGSGCTFVIAMDKANVSGISPGGYITEFDESGQSLTGTLALQTPTAFSTSTVTGGYAFGLSGFQGSSATHAGVIGEMQLSNPKVSSLELLSSVLNSTLNSTPYTSTTGTYTISSTVTGRGTLTLPLTSPSAGGTLSLVFYVVSGQELYIVSVGTASGTSPSTLLSGQATTQTTKSGSFNAASLTGTAVERLTRTISSTSGGTTTYSPYVQLGTYTFDGISNATIAYDQNTAGTASQATGIGAYTVAINGRAAIPSIASGIGGCANCTAPTVFIYLTGLDTGYQMDFTNGIDTGTIEQQTTTSNFSGGYVSGTVMPVSQTSTYATETLTSNGASTLAITEDLNEDSLLIMAGEPIAATYSVDTNGRVAATASGTSPLYYLVSPTRAFGIDLSSTEPVLIEVNQ
jgi:hypothetical protein